VLHSNGYFQPHGRTGPARKTGLVPVYYNKIQYIYEKNKDKNIDKKIIKERIQEINSYRKILKELVKEPVIKQRTKEWFDARENRLTASDLYDAII